MIKCKYKFKTERICSFFLNDCTTDKMKLTVGRDNCFAVSVNSRYTFIIQFIR